jgi:hypothetical protein
VLTNYLTVDSADHFNKQVQHAIVDEVCMAAPDKGITLPFEKIKVLGERADTAVIQLTYNGYNVFALIPSKLADTIDRDINGIRV